MAEYRLPKDLQVTLREYFRHCRTLARERYYHDLLVQMSPALRGQVAVFCHRCARAAVALRPASATRVPPHRGSVVCTSAR